MSLFVPSQRNEEVPSGENSSVWERQAERPTAMPNDKKMKVAVRSGSLTSVALALAACGGDGASDESKGVETDVADPVIPESGAGVIDASYPQLIFSQDKIVYRDVTVDQENYRSTPVVSLFLATDVNLDDRTDFLVHLWWEAYEANDVFTTEPTPDLLLMYVQDEDGAFKLSNQEVFGTALPSLGGASRKVSHKDINGDGVQDFAFAMNMEDLRDQAGDSDINAQPTIVLSNGVGGYEVIRLGEAAWGHGVEIIELPNSIFDVAFGGYSGNNRQMFRFDNGEFIDVIDQYPVDLFYGVWASTINSFFSADENVTFITSSISDNIYASELTQNELGEPFYQLEQVEQGFIVHVVTEVGAYELYREVKPSDYQMKTEMDTIYNGLTVHILDDGKALTHYTIDAQRIFQEDGGRIVLVNKISASLLEDSVNLVTGEILIDHAPKPYTTYSFFSLDVDGVVELNVEFEEEFGNINTNFFDVLDLDGNGYFDLVVHVFNRPWEDTLKTQNLPLIYLNDGNDLLVRVDPLDFLDERNLLVGNFDLSLQTSMFDLNGDGKLNIFQYPEVFQDEMTIHYSDVLI